MNSTQLPSWAFGPFIRPENINPILRPIPDLTFKCPIRKSPVKWEGLHNFNPAAIVKDNKIFLVYRAEDGSGKMKIGGHTSRLGLAESSDGLHFTKLPAPVVFPDLDDQLKHEWPGGAEDPRMVESDTGDFILTYTQKGMLVSRLGIAVSKDLIHWKKMGLAFPRVGPPYLNWYTKAASIVCGIVDGRLKAIKINGKYWMYWGVRVLRTATSTDLIHWTTNNIIIRKRLGYFDSILNEAGPPAVMTENGIVLIYNGKNDPEHGDPALTPNLYTGGQLLFDKNDPTKCLGRLDHPFFQPELPWEKTGQYIAGATFLEGLVYFQKKWFMYYGCSDSVVGVAVWDPSN